MIARILPGHAPQANRLLGECVLGARPTAPAVSSSSSSAARVSIEAAGSGKRIIPSLPVDLATTTVRALKAQIKAAALAMTPPLLPTNGLFRLFLGHGGPLLDAWRGRGAGTGLAERGVEDGATLVVVPYAANLGSGNKRIHKDLLCFQGMRAIHKNDQHAFTCARAHCKIECDSYDVRFGVRTASLAVA